MAKCNKERSRAVRVLAVDVNRTVDRVCWAASTGSSLSYNYLSERNMQVNSVGQAASQRFPLMPEETSLAQPFVLCLSTLLPISYSTVHSAPFADDRSSVNSEGSCK